VSSSGSAPKGKAVQVEGVPCLDVDVVRDPRALDADGRAAFEHLHPSTLLTEWACRQILISSQPGN
jgi:hypothetical protein